MQTREQAEIVDLTPDDVSLVIYDAPLVVDLRADDIGLVVDLISAVIRVVLVVPKIDPFVSAIPLVTSYQGRAVPRAAPVALERLIVLLHIYGLLLPAHHIARIVRIILVEAPVLSRIPAVRLVPSHKLRPIV